MGSTNASNETSNIAAASRALHGLGGPWTGQGPNFDKRKRAAMGLKLSGPDWARPHTIGPPTPVLLKTNKLTTDTNKIKPFNLYINNRYKYIIINNNSRYVQCSHF